VKFGLKAYHKHIHKFYTKYCLKVNNYKHGDGAKLLSHIGKFIVVGSYVSGNYAYFISNFSCRYQWEDTDAQGSFQKFPLWLCQH